MAKTSAHKTTATKTSGARTKSPRIPKSVMGAVHAALDKKALSVVVLDLRKASGFTDYFVICTGNNPRQITAIADAVEERLRVDFGERPHLKEGIEKSQWVLLDYFNFVVHVFTPECRDFYSLERLWGNAERHELSRTGVDALIAASLAPPCAVCHLPLDCPSAGCVCPTCWAAVIPTATLPWTSADITIGLAAGRYEGALRDVIHAFKYEGRRSLAAPLGALMRESGRTVLEDADCVVPVPLHPWRRMRRGFNQARDLARQLDRPVVNALWRTRATPPQMSLDAITRRTNLRDAFVLSPIVRSTRCGARLYGAPITNRTIVLIDDVRTTGSTLSECAKVLVDAGAREVRALTIAVA